MEKRFLKASLWSILLFFVFAAGAIGNYSGGSPTDSVGIKGFSFTNNFLSDLGVVNTYAHTTQFVTNVLWAFALAAAALGIICLVTAITKLLAPRVTAFCAALSLMLVILLPSDIFFWPHRIALLSFVILLLATLVLIPKRTPMLNVALVIVGAYLAFLLAAPRPDVDQTARSLHIGMQRLFVIFTFASLAGDVRRRLIK